MRLSLFGTLLITLSVALCAFFAYYFRKEQLKTAVANELLAVVNSTAAIVEGERHNRIFRNEKDEINGLDDFNALRALLQEVKKRNHLSGHGSPIYTLRKTPDYAQHHELEFVVMTDPDKDGVFFVGSRYPVTPHLASALEGKPAATGLYEDEEGFWISAAAPILDRTGKVVGVLQADRTINYFFAEARRSALWTMSSALVSALIGWALTWIYSRTLVKPIVDLAQATNRLGQGDLKVRVQLDRNDELGDLEKDFNSLARKLEEAHARDEAHVQHMEAAHLAIEESNRELEKANADLAKSCDEARQLAEAAEAASRAKSEFLSIMSHELRTPLNGVLGFASVLENSGLDAELTDCARTIRTSGESLLSLISDVLLYTQLEGGTAVLSEAPFSPRNLIEEMATPYAALCASKQIDFQLEFVPGIPDRPVADSQKIQRVVRHLIDNAVKFTRQGSVRVVVESLPMQESHGVGNAIQAYLRITVFDTGIGVTESHRARLFQPFSQMDSSTSREFEGMGLGLALSSRLVARMGGELGYQPRSDGPGSTFAVVFPLRGSDSVSNAFPEPGPGTRSKNPISPPGTPPRFGF